jgi:hypothetical protein
MERCCARKVLCASTMLLVSCTQICLLSLLPLAPCRSLGKACSNIASYATAANCFRWRTYSVSSPLASNSHKCRLFMSSIIFRLRSLIATKKRAHLRHTAEKRRTQCTRTHCGSNSNRAIFSPLDIKLGHSFGDSPKSPSHLIHNNQFSQQQGWERQARSFKSYHIPVQQQLDWNQQAVIPNHPIIIIYDQYRSQDSHKPTIGSVWLEYWL